MNYINIQYTGAEARASLLRDTASGQIGTLRAQFVFSSDWDAYPLRTAVFAGSGKTAAVPLDEENGCTVPASVLEHCGRLYAGAFANVEDGGVLRYVGQADSVFVPCGVPTDAADPPITDPTLYEQLLCRLSGKLDAKQGAENAGRALVVGEDGTVRPGDYAGGGLSGQELQEAVNTALAQAKESGAFDGADGQDGAAGKSAYEYAQDGGYTGTEAEFAGKLAAEYVPVSKITLGVHTDGLVYVFVNGAPVGNGVEMTVSSDLYGYVDSENNVVVKGSLADGTYSVKYEMEDGSTVAIGDLVLDSNVYYSVTNNLTNCVTDNSAAQVIQGESYSAAITANDGYELSSVVVTMGGTDISASAVSGGTISIASVTGNIVITAAAEEVAASYTNLADPTSSDWLTDNRLGSDGSPRTDATGVVVTNFVGPLAEGDVIRVKGIDLTTYNTCPYNYQKTCLSAAKLSAQTAYFSDITVTSAGATFAIINYGGVVGGYVRFSGVPNGSTSNIIITKNEPIE